MTHRPGPRQRAILEQMRAAAELWRVGNAWRLDDRPVPHSTMAGLFDFGYIFGDSSAYDANGLWLRTRYVLTERGKAAIG